MIRVLIADDHAIVRKGMIQILNDAGLACIIDEAANAHEAIQLTRSHQYNVVLLDIAMPGKSGVDVLKQLHNEFPKLPILVLSMYPEEQYAVRLIRIGAVGYITKESAPHQLAEAVRTVLDGRKYISPEVAELLAESLSKNIHRGDEENLHQLLSDREYHVFLEMSRGKSQTDIAKELSLSVKTIASYRSRILQKLALGSNAEMTLYASKHKLIE